MAQYQYVDGTVAFANLDEHEMFNGKTTGAYSLVVTLDGTASEQLEAQGIRLKEYNGNMQRKFKSRYDVKVVDVDGEAISKSSVRYGDKVRVKYSLGNPHPQWGITPYLAGVKVIEQHEDEGGDF